MKKGLYEQISYDVRSMYTPLEEAISEIHQRRKDVALKERVEAYLKYDIPEHFRGEGPILYLPRHVATPNYEALHFIELGKAFGLRMVISQDRKGKFVAHNELKRALGKLAVTKGFSYRHDEITENFTIIDFAKAQGKPFSDIYTTNNINLVDFHNSLFAKLEITQVEIVDESEWIDRNFRDNLKEQYKRMLALTCVHGIMFESFPECEQQFVDSVFGPAFVEFADELNLRPLIVEHIDAQLELTRNWNGYPSALYQFIKRGLEGVTM